MASSEYAGKFSEGNFNLLFVIGAPGQGKSRAFEASAQDTPYCHLLKWHFTTATGLYRNSSQPLQEAPRCRTDWTPSTYCIMVNMSETSAIPRPEALRWQSSRVPAFR